MFLTATPSIYQNLFLFIFPLIWYKHTRKRIGVNGHISTEKVSITPFGECLSLFGADVSVLDSIRTYLLQDCSYQILWGNFDSPKISKIIAKIKNEYFSQEDAWDANMNSEHVKIK